MTKVNMILNRNEWIVIGISGVTCGGKTTLANKLKNTLTPSYIFHQDKYFYPDDSPNHVKCEYLEHNNYDILSALNMDSMYKNIVETMNGENKAHSVNLQRKPDMFSAEGKKFLIAEGFTVLNYAPINDLCDLRYYMVLEYGECCARRVYRVYDPPDVPGYFEQCVWPEHIKYRAQMERDKRVTLVDGTRHDIFDEIMNNLIAMGVGKIHS